MGLRKAPLAFWNALAGVCINFGKGCERSYLVIVVNLITINQWTNLYFKKLTHLSQTIWRRTAYANAQGVKRDFVQAYAWYTLAIENFPKVDQFGRDRALKNRMVIAKLMTPDEIAKAKLIIANLKNK